MTCRELVEFLMDYLDGHLSGPERLCFEEHGGSARTALLTWRPTRKPSDSARTPARRATMRSLPTYRRMWFVPSCQPDGGRHCFRWKTRALVTLRPGRSSKDVTGLRVSNLKHRSQPCVSRPRRGDW